MADTSNQYVTYGISGGLLTFLVPLFDSHYIEVLWQAREQGANAGKKSDRAEEWVCWCLGAAMFAHLRGVHRY